MCERTRESRINACANAHAQLLRSKWDQLRSKRDLLRSKRDLLRSKRDLFRSKRDQLKSKRDLVSTRETRVLATCRGPRVLRGHVSTFKSAQKLEQFVLISLSLSLSLSVYILYYISYYIKTWAVRAYVCGCVCVCVCMYILYYISYYIKTWAVRALCVCVWVWVCVFIIYYISYSIKTWAVRARHHVASGRVKRDLLRSKRDTKFWRDWCVCWWLCGWWRWVGGMGAWVGGWAYEKNREHSADPAQQNFWRDWMRDLRQGDVPVNERKSVKKNVKNKWTNVKTNEKM